MTWILLAIAIVCEVSAAMVLRASEGLRRKKWIPVLVILYGGAFALLALILSTGASIGIVYGIWASCGVALTAVAAWAIFKEPLSWRAAAGIVLIAIGVLMIEIGVNAS